MEEEKSSELIYNFWERAIPVPGKFVRFSSFIAHRVSSCESFAKLEGDRSGHYWH